MIDDWEESFAPKTPDGPGEDLGMCDDDWDSLDLRVSTVFKPSAPVSRAELFAGRRVELRKVIDSINQDGLHAVLYGDRGVGKTSLANVLLPKLSSAFNIPVLVPTINCLHEDTYDDIWQRMFERLLELLEERDVVGVGSADVEFLRQVASGSRGEITPDLVRRVLTKVGDAASIVAPVFDEFDAVDDFPARVKMSDTLKYLSDRNVPATIVLVGMARDIDSLIDNHQSVERCLNQISVPRMSRSETEEIIATGFNRLGMTIETPALQECSRLVQGLPHYAHLLGLHAARTAIDDRELNVDLGLMPAAIERALAGAQGSIQSDYVTATTSARKDALYKHVLLAAALTECDELGYFYPSDVQPMFSRVMRKQRGVDTFNKHLGEFCTPTRAEVLYCDERMARKRYRFSSPMLQPYVLLRGLSEGMLTEDDLQQTKLKDPDGQRRLF